MVFSSEVQAQDSAGTLFTSQIFSFLLLKQTAQLAKGKGLEYDLYDPPSTTLHRMLPSWVFHCSFVFGGTPTHFLLQQLPLRLNKNSTLTGLDAWYNQNHQRWHRPNTQASYRFLHCPAVPAPVPVLHLDESSPLTNCEMKRSTVLKRVCVFTTLQHKQSIVLIVMIIIRVNYVLNM